MSFHDLSTDERLQPLLAFHRRTERHLAQLAALASELDGGRLAAQICGTASSLLHELGCARAEQHVLEESRLLPAIERRIRDAAALAEFRDLRAMIAAEHESIAEAWRPLRRPLEAVSEGVLRPLDHGAVAAFRALCARHIVEEESALHRFALRVRRARIAA